MSPVIHNNEQSDQESIQAAEKSVSENILNSFDLPTSVQSAVDSKIKEEEEKPEVEVEEEEEAELPESLDSKEEKEETKESEESEDKEDEELIPKSKFQKRLDEMTREKRLLEMRLKALEEKAVQSQPQDEDLIKLEKMGETELQNLKRQTRLAQLKNASDDDMVSKLMELEDKIDATLRSVPQRFQQNQVQQFNEAVYMTSQEIPNFNKVSKDVFNLAKQIYDTAPELHQTVSGQARAWNLAVQHYKLMQEANVGKSKVAELGRQVNTLKKKVSVDGVSRKASQEPDSATKLFRKAKNGEIRDKLEFFKKTLNTDTQVDGFLEKNVF